MMRTQHKKLKCSNLITIVLAVLILSSLLAGLATIQAVSATRGTVSVQFDDGFQTQYDYALSIVAGKRNKSNLLREHSYNQYALFHELNRTLNSTK